MKKGSGIKIIAKNRRASFDFHLLERFQQKIEKGIFKTEANVDVNFPPYQVGVDFIPPSPYRFSNFMNQRTM